jgi:hypothetical protein
LDELLHHGRLKFWHHPGRINGMPEIGHQSRQIQHGIIPACLEAADRRDPPPPSAWPSPPAAPFAVKRNSLNRPQSLPVARRAFQAGVSSYAFYKFF